MSESLADELRALPPELRRMLERHRFDPSWLCAQADRIAGGAARKNRVHGVVAPPAAEDVVTLPAPSSARGQELYRLGLEALRAGRCAAVVLAGGMATRMGGVVKALVEALPGRRFLDLRLAENRHLSELAGRRIPLWLMTSHATDEAIRQALGARLDGFHLETFTQNLSLRLTPEGRLFRDDTGAPSEHAPGHGDLPGALQESGLIDRFVQDGGRTVMVANLDNLGATLDPLIVGFHLEHQKPVTCEVVDKVGSDRGGIPVRVDGRPVILEEFRLPEDFDASSVRVFNTNTFHFDALVLQKLDMDWTFFVVEKKVDGRPAVQLERLINEVTSHLETQYLRVPREGAESRFLPVKDHEELKQRQPELQAVARARGMLD